MGREMPVRAIRLDQRHGGSDMPCFRENPGGNGRRGRRDRSGGRGVGREPETLASLGIELVLALQQRVDHSQELARLGTLDHAVIVGAGDGHDLADAQLTNALRRDRFELWRVADGSHREDGALAGHEARHRSHRAEAAGIGERHGGAGEIVRHQPVGAGLLHQLLVACQEGGEVHLLGVPDDRHHEAASPILPGYIDRQAEVDAVRGHAVDHVVLDQHRVAHVRMGPGRLNDGPRDQVGERHLFAAARGLEGGIERLPLGLEH